MNRLKKLIYKIHETPVIFSFLAMLAISCKMECIDGAKDTILLNGLYKLYNSFGDYNFADVFILIAVYVLIRYVTQNSNGIEKLTLLFSAMFSVLYVISMSYKKYDSLQFVCGDRSQIIISGICIIGYIILFYYTLKFIEICMEKCNGITKTDEYNGFWHKNIGVISFCAVFICWLPWIIMNYPGSIGNDAKYQLRQYFGINEFTAHHPPLSTWIMGTLAYIGREVMDINFGIFLYVFLQTVFGALISAISIKKLSQLGVGLKYCMLAILFFCLPLWGGAVQFYNKDFLYTEVVCLFCICIMEIVKTGLCTIKNAVIVVIVGILASLLRNNGIYTVIPTILVLAVWLKNIDRKRMWGAVCATLIIYYGIVKIAYPLAGITPGSIREMLSIPFMQTARYVCTYGDEVTEYEKEVIDSVLDYEALVNYNPKHADPVKDTYKNDNSKLPEYFKVWFKMFLKHPGNYVEAFLNKGADYMAPVDASSSGQLILVYRTDDFSSKMGITHPFGHRFIDLLTETGKFFMEFPPFELLYMAGTYTWVLSVCILLLARKKIYHGIILFIPGIMNVLICIASPTWDIRYALPLMAVIPLYVGWTWYMVKIHRTMEKA